MSPGPVLAVVRLEESGPRATALNRTGWKHPVQRGLLVRVRPPAKMSDVDNVLALRNHSFEKWVAALHQVADGPNDHRPKAGYLASLAVLPGNRVTKPTGQSA